MDLKKKYKFDINGTSYNSFNFYPAVFLSVENFHTHRAQVKKSREDRMAKILETLAKQTHTMDSRSISHLEQILGIVKVD